MHSYFNDEKDDETEQYKLRLFVSGTSPNSVRAINNLQKICEAHLKGRYELEIIDIHQQAELVKTENVVAVPTLVKKSPLPQRRLVGDMSVKERVLRGLGLM
ncbi:MAG: circadian clock KaiB family protein [Daejeonella sp.]